MIQDLKFLAGVILFYAGIVLIDWLVGVTAPVLGVLFLTSLIWVLIWMLIKIVRASK